MRQATVCGHLIGGDEARPCVLKPGHKSRDHLDAAQREQKRKYYEENREQIAEQKRKYYEENREQIADQARKYREENRDKVLERKRKYYEENREQCAERMRQYNEKNRDRKREYDRNRREENREQLAEQARKYREENRDKVLERKRKYYEENRERLTEYRRNWYEENRERLTEYRRNWYEENYVPAPAQYPPDHPGWIYFLLSDYDLLYVGQTIRPEKRLYEHKRSQPWGDLITRVEMLPMPYSGLDRAETVLIHRYHPYGNTLCRACEGSRIGNDAVRDQPWVINVPGVP